MFAAGPMIVRCRTKTGKFEVANLHRPDGAFIPEKTNECAQESPEDLCTHGVLLDLLSYLRWLSL